MAGPGRLALPARGHLSTAALAAASIVAAWSLLLVHHGASSAGGVFAMWNLMMVAMMLPSLLPWLFLFEGRNAALFVSGYFLVWLVYCGLATAAQVLLQGSGLLDERLALGSRGGAAVLLAAGAFQLTPLKESCLRHCRSPVGYLLMRWSSRAGWPFRVGLGHGVHCLGCCWALMALAFVLGVMSVWWMAALTLALVVEKVAPGGMQASRWLGVGLIAWGLVALAG